MDHQDSQQSLNLGKYCIQISEEPISLSVGSFWKRRQQPANDEQTNNNEVNSTKTNVFESPAKKFASSLIVKQAQDLSPVNSDTQSGTNHPNENTAASCENSSIINRFRIFNDRLDGKSSESSLISSAGCPSFADIRSQELCIDTQQSEASVPKDIDEDTHESFTVDLSPNIFTNCDEATTQSDHTCSAQLGPNSSSSPPYDTEFPRQMRRKVYPKQRQFEKILSDVRFVLSGYENPRRSKIRDLALSMGAKYQPSWNRFCTHLICAFKNTPKYKEVMAENGRIVREHWIQECSRQRELLDWRNFKLGKYPYPDSEEEVDVDDLDYALKTSYNVDRP